MRTILTAVAVMLVGTAAYAGNLPQPVPEIDALSGLAAIAVVGAAVALIRERSK